jgi:hypothetical protein
MGIPIIVRRYRVPGVLLAQECLQAIPQYIADGLSMQARIAPYLVREGRIDAAHEGFVLFRFGAATRTASGASHGQCSSVWGISRMMSDRIEERGGEVKRLMYDKKGEDLIRDDMLSLTRGRGRGGEQFQGYDHNLDDM